MEFFAQFFKVFVSYIHDIWLTLAIGFFLSGFLYQFFPTRLIEKYLGRKSLQSILIAATIGVVLPVCCIGALPIALTLKRKGASLGSVLAFLVATPATSIPALLVCLKLLGPVFTATIFFAVIVMAVILGILSDVFRFEKPGTNTIDLSLNQKSCCSENEISANNIPLRKKIQQALYYAFVTLPKTIGLEIILGITLSSFIVICEPIQHFIHEHLMGFVGYVFVVIFGLITYVCSTASVPMADAFIKSGMSQGQALTYLLVGPITSYGTILVIKKDFGWKVLVLYLSVITTVSLLSGLILDMFI